MEQKKIPVTIYDKGCYRQQKLALCTKRDTVKNGKISKEYVVDEYVKEWYIDNTTNYAFKELEDAMTFRGHVKHAQKMFYLLTSNSKDKTFIVLTDEEEWWEIILSNKELFCKIIRTHSNEFESIFKVFYSLKYEKWIELKISDISTTKRMELVAKYIKPKKKKQNK